MFPVLRGVELKNVEEVSIPDNVRELCDALKCV